MGQVDPSKPHLFRRHTLSKTMNQEWDVIPNTSDPRQGKCREYGCGWIQMANRCQGGTHIEPQEHAYGTRRKMIRRPTRDIKEYLCHHPRLAGGRSCILPAGLAVTLRAISAQVVVLMTLELEPILIVPEIGGTQANLISSLSEAPPLAYFVHNTYLDPSVFGAAWFKCKGRHL